MEQGHSVSHELKARIEESLAGAKVLVHVEPSECIELLPENDKDICCMRDELIKDMRVSEVKGLRGIRYRGDLRVEAELLLDPKVSLAESSALTLELTDRLKTCFHHVHEIVLSIRPGDGWQKAIHDDDRERIIKLVGEHQDSFAGIHKLDVASSGNIHRIHLALGVPYSLPVYEANLVARHIESDIKKLFPESVDVDIHIEPCNENCVSCGVACKSKKLRTR